jgi:hypothetical protein
MAAQKARLAKLGQDGWEPMPLQATGGGGLGILWYFKRQL